MEVYNKINKDIYMALIIGLIILVIPVTFYLGIAYAFYRMSKTNFEFGG